MRKIGWRQKKCRRPQVGVRLDCPGASPGAADAPRRQYPHLSRDGRRPAMRRKGGRCAGRRRPDNRRDGDNLGKLLTWPACYVKLVQLMDTWVGCRLRASCRCCRSRHRHGLCDGQTPRGAVQWVCASVYLLRQGVVASCERLGAGRESASLSAGWKGDAGIKVNSTARSFCLGHSSVFGLES